MTKSILTPFQKNILDNLSKNDFITKNFWFSGGTALSEFYLQHRYSEDLDFFSNNEIPIEEVRAVVYPIFKEIGVESLEYREILSSKIFFLKNNPRETVKADFNFFPYERFGQEKKYHKLRVDGLMDIAISKLDTILTRNKARDFVDLYFIQKKHPYKIEFLLEKLEKRAMWKIDPIQLGSSFLKIKKLVDYPKMIKDFSKEEMIKYFEDLAAGLKDKIVK